MCRRRRSGAENGAVVLEFVLIVPIFLIFVFGIFEGARFVTTQMTLRSAAREAVRHGALRAGSPPRFTETSSIKAKARAVALMPSLTDADITVGCVGGSGNPAPPWTTCSESAVEGTRLAVKVTTTYEAITPLVGTFFEGRALESTSFRSLSP